ncbi:DUF6216 family protein [Janthinobacterium rivuli]|uniref:DUF6216 family protein n=1 Tax=Janthinobacterium rivuli TaxID=2751478 RepID=UPI00383BE857
MENKDDFLNIGQVLDVGTITPFLLFICSLFFLVYIRTKSTHSIMSRFWRIFNGNVVYDDVEINKILDSRSALMQFRFTTGIPIRLRKQIGPLIRWTNKNSEDLGDVGKCGHLFDLEIPKLRKLDKKMMAIYIFILPLAFSAFFFTLIPTTYFSVTKRALLKITASENWILLGNDSARRIIFFSSESYTTLDKESCISPDEKTEHSTKLEKKDIELICNSINKGNDEKFIKDSLYTQRIFFAPLSILLLCAITLCCKWAFNFSNWNSMRSRLKKIHPNNSY